VRVQHRGLPGLGELYGHVAAEFRRRYIQESGEGAELAIHAPGLFEGPVFRPRALDGRSRGDRPRWFGEAAIGGSGVRGLAMIWPSWISWLGA